MGWGKGERFCGEARNHEQISVAQRAGCERLLLYLYLDHSLFKPHLFPILDIKLWLEHGLAGDFSHVTDGSVSLFCHYLTSLSHPFPVQSLPSLRLSQLRHGLGKLVCKFNGTAWII